MHKYVLLAMVFLSSCVGASKDVNLYQQVLAHCKEEPTPYIALDNRYDFSKLEKIDSPVLNLLKKFKEISPTTGYENEGCFNLVFYKSYFSISKDLIGFIIAQSICDCCGRDELVLVIMDKSGDIKSSLVVAEKRSMSECDHIIQTKVSEDTFIVSEKDDCTILDGKDIGLTAIDSFTNIYQLYQSGQLKKLSSIHTKLVR